MAPYTGRSGAVAQTFRHQPLPFRKIGKGFGRRRRSSDVVGVGSAWPGGRGEGVVAVLIVNELEARRASGIAATDRHGNLPSVFQVQNVNEVLVAPALMWPWAISSLTKPILSYY